MALRINGAIHTDGQPLRINGVQASTVRVNGVVAWVDVTEIILPQSNDNFNVGNWLNTHYPDVSPVRLINNLIQPRFKFENLLGKTVEFINNGEIRGTRAGFDAIVISEPIKLINNGWIRGAGGNGGIGGVGGIGGNGGRGGTGGKGADIAATYTRTYTDRFIGYDPWTAWYEFKAENIINVYDNSSTTTVGVPRGVTTIIHGNFKFIRGALRSDTGNVITYGLTKDTISVPAKIGGLGGAGGNGGTANGNGGAGGAGGAGQSFLTARTDGAVGGTGVVGGNGLGGSGGFGSIPAGGNSGGTGGTGGKKGNGGNGGRGGHGGDWAVAGGEGITSAGGFTGATGSNGAVGGGGGSAGAAGIVGTAGGNAAAGVAGDNAGAAITGSVYLSGDSVTGNVNGEILQ